jgi:hypothetical protein
MFTSPVRLGSSAAADQWDAAPLSRSAGALSRFQRRQLAGMPLPTATTQLNTRRRRERTIGCAVLGTRDRLGGGVPPRSAAFASSLFGDSTSLIRYLTDLT